MENSIQTLRNASTTTLSITQRVDKAERESAFVADYDLPTFVKLCSKVCAMYGIALPEAQLLQMLHEFIGKHFRWVTFEHFNLAFELNAANELSKKAEHFGALSVSFIGDVLTHYKPHRDKANLQIQREIAQSIEEKSQQIKENEMAVNDDSWRRMLKEDIDSFKQGKMTTLELRGVSMMRWLEESKRITAETFTDEEYNLCKAKARKTVFNEQQLSKGMVERMSDRKRQLLKESIQFEGLRELYKLYLSKQ
jgi:hypothetical protein